MGCHWRPRASPALLASLLPALAMLPAIGGGLRAQCELQKIGAADPSSSDYFGNPVALSGDLAIAGSVRSDGEASESGAAYLFRRHGAEWRPEMKLTAANGETFDYYGLGVALDGDRALVGAPSHTLSAGATGKVYLYERTGFFWEPAAEFLPAGLDPFDDFGISVAIDGPLIAIGAPGDDDQALDAGAVWIFRLVGGAWLFEAKLFAADAAEDDRFGWTVALDGGTLLASAVRDDDAGSQSGSAYAFVSSGGGWSQEQKLVASDAAPTNWFGFSLWLDGDVAILGAHFADADSGKAYIFRRSGTVWTEEAILLGSDTALGDHFGLAVAIEGDRALVGARRDDDNGMDSGSAYLFERQGGAWGQTAKLLASDGAPFDHYGRAVALEGGIALIGAYQVDSMAGAAYLHAIGAAPDCDGDGAADLCEIALGSAVDCDRDGVPDACAIAQGAAEDLDLDGIPDRCESPPHIRGDVDGNGAILVNDAILVLAALFSGGSLPCHDAADLDDDGQVLLGDGILQLGYLFSGAVAPSPPFPECGPDVTPDAAGGDLGCATAPICP